MHVHSTKEDYLIKGHNGLETCVILSELTIFAKDRKFMERRTVKDVLRRFNEHGVRYCLVGGLSLAHHSIPQRTQDVDILVLPEDLPLVQRLLNGYQQRDRADVLIFQISETQIDILPADLPAKRRAVLDCVDEVLDELVVKVVNLRDLILLKMWTAPDRPKRFKRLRDETDIVGLIEMNADKVSAADIAYICDSLLKMVYSAEDVQKYRAQIEWLNSELEKLGLNDRRYALT